MAAFYSNEVFYCFQVMHEDFEKAKDVIVSKKKDRFEGLYI